MCKYVPNISWDILMLKHHLSLFFLICSSNVTGYRLFNLAVLRPSWLFHYRSEHRDCPKKWVMSQVDALSGPLGCIIRGESEGVPKERGGTRV